MSGKREFNRDAALQYAKESGIEIPEEATDKALVRIISTEIGKQEDNCTACSGKGDIHYIKPTDTFCWFCGDDCSEDGASSTFKPPAKEKQKEEKQKEEPAKKIHIVDKTKKPAAKETEAKEEPEKKPAKKSAEKPAKEETEVTKFKPEQLDKLVSKIKGLDRSSGAAAWQIGAVLGQILNGKAYLVRHDTFDDFCVKELGYTRASAYGFVRISEKFDEEDASQLGVGKLLLLARAPTEAVPKLLEAAKDAEDGGKAAPPDKLKEMVHTAVEHARKKAKKPAGEKRGRPKLSVYRSFIGLGFKGDYDEKNEKKALVCLDEYVAVEVTMLAKGVKLDFIELEQEEAEE